MAFPWRSRRTAPIDEEIPGLFDEAPEPGGSATFKVFDGTWDSILGATALGYSNILAQRLVAGADPNIRDTRGRTALHLAVEHRRRDAMAMLINAFADPNEADADGQTPLLWAIVLDWPWAVDFLHASGARIGFAEALAQGEVTLAAEQLTNVNLDAPVADRMTLLFRSAAMGDFPATRLLLERGADPNIPPPPALTPLDAAAEVSRGRILRLLLDYGADPRLARANDPTTIRRWAGREVDSDSDSPRPIDGQDYVRPDLSYYNGSQ